MLLGKPIEVLIKAVPVDGQMKMLEIIFSLGQVKLHKWSNGLTFTRDLRRNALRKLADRSFVDQQILLGLPKHVDESWSNNQATSINRALGFYLGSGVSNEGDAITDNSKISVKPWIAAAIDDFAVANEHVVLLREG